MLPRSISRAASVLSHRAEGSRAAPVCVSLPQTDTQMHRRLGGGWSGLRSHLSPIGRCTLGQAIGHEASVRLASSAGASPRTRTVGKEGMVALTPLSTSSRDFSDIILCLDEAASLHHVVSGIAVIDTSDATIMTACVSEHHRLSRSPPSSRGAGKEGCKKPPARRSSPRRGDASPSSSDLPHNSRPPPLPRISVCVSICTYDEDAV